MIRLQPCLQYPNGRWDTPFVHANETHPAANILFEFGLSYEGLASLPLPPPRTEDWERVQDMLGPVAKMLSAVHAESPMDSVILGRSVFFLLGKEYFIYALAEHVPEKRRKEFINAMNQQTFDKPREIILINTTPITPVKSGCLKRFRIPGYECWFDPVKKGMLSLGISNLLDPQRRGEITGANLGNLLDYFFGIQRPKEGKWHLRAVLRAVQGEVIADEPSFASFIREQVSNLPLLGSKLHLVASRLSTEPVSDLRAMVAYIAKLIPELDVSKLIETMEIPDNGLTAEAERFRKICPVELAECHELAIDLLKANAPLGKSLAHRIAKEETNLSHCLQFAKKLFALSPRLAAGFTGEALSRFTIDKFERHAMFRKYLAAKVATPTLFASLVKEGEKFPLEALVDYSSLIQSPESAIAFIRRLEPQQRFWLSESYLKQLGDLSYWIEIESLGGFTKSPEYTARLTEIFLREPRETPALAPLRKQIPKNVATSAAERNRLVLLLEEDPDAFYALYQSHKKEWILSDPDIARLLVKMVEVFKAKGMWDRYFSALNHSVKRGGPCSIAGVPVQEAMRIFDYPSLVLPAHERETLFLHDPTRKEAFEDAVFPSVLHKALEMGKLTPQSVSILQEAKGVVDVHLARSSSPFSVLELLNRHAIPFTRTPALGLSMSGNLRGAEILAKEPAGLGTSLSTLAPLVLKSFPNRRLLNEWVKLQVSFTPDELSLIYSRHADLNEPNLAKIITLEAPIPVILQYVKSSKLVPMEFLLELNLRQNPELIIPVMRQAMRRSREEVNILGLLLNVNPRTDPKSLAVCATAAFYAGSFPTGVLILHWCLTKGKSEELSEALKAFQNAPEFYTYVMEESLAICMKIIEWGHGLSPFVGHVLLAKSSKQARECLSLVVEKQLPISSFCRRNAALFLDAEENLDSFSLLSLTQYPENFEYCGVPKQDDEEHVNAVVSILGKALEMSQGLFRPGILDYLKKCAHIPKIRELESSFLWMCKFLKPAMTDEKKITEFLACVRDGMPVSPFLLYTSYISLHRVGRLNEFADVIQTTELALDFIALRLAINKSSREGLEELAERFGFREKFFGEDPVQARINIALLIADLAVKLRLPFDIFPFYKEAAELGSLEAVQKAANYYANEPDKVEEILKIGASWGDPVVISELGVVYQAKGDLENAFRCFQEACEKDNSIATYNLGYLYLQSGQTDLAKKYFIIAAERGETDAMFMLGRLAESKGNSNLALDWFTQAGERGHEQALTVLKERFS